MNPATLSRTLLAGSLLAGSSLACSEPPAATPFLGGSGQTVSGTSGGGASGAGGAGVVGGSSSSGTGGVSAGISPVAGNAGNAGSAGGAGSGFGPFEGGALAAVSLTYDDGLDPQLATAQPALEAAGFFGTFFLSNFEGSDHNWSLPNATDPLSPRHLAWQAAGQKGHELADHTVNHPCDNPGKDPNYHFVKYTMARMSMELDDSLARLMRLGATAPITFAYPCGTDKTGIGSGAEDYSALVAERFVAARVSDEGIADPATVDLHHVPHLSAAAKTGDELKAMVDQAIAAKGWLVLLFHGVGVETLTCPQGLVYQPQTCMINYITTSTEAHAALVQYLADKKTEAWTATFKQVASYVQSKR